MKTIAEPGQACGRRIETSAKELSRIKADHERDNNIVINQAS